MPGLLDRFRHGAPPGAAVPGAAVPSDPREAARLELAPVFAAAQAATGEAEALVAAAVRDAEAERRSAERDAAAVLQQAAQEATLARATSTQRSEYQAKAIGDAAQAAAERRIREARERAGVEATGIVAAVVDELRALAHEEPP